MFHNVTQASQSGVRAAGVLFGAAMCAAVLLASVAVPAGYELKARAGDPPADFTQRLIVGAQTDSLPTIAIIGRTQG